MIVLSGICKKCNELCNAIRFQQNFASWTSGNDDIDKFIQDIQLSAHDYRKVSKNAVEWIPYNRFCNIEYIEKIEVFRANWIDGYIYELNDHNWQRFDQNMTMTLKSLNDPKNLTLELINEV
jgi:hypothetical protein